MSLPEPFPGLVIRYAYLWRNEALAGAEDGRKDRPCVIVVAVRKISGRTTVLVAPVTHAPPKVTDLAVALPDETKRRLGLDADASWIIASDLNEFDWPGVDIRMTPSGAWAYGALPSTLFDRLKRRVLELARQKQAKITRRSN